MPKLLVKRKAYKRKGGIKVKSATFKIKDRGKKGRTPKSKQFFNPQVHTGRSKEMDAESRRRLVLNAHDGDVLASARSMLALSNVSVDKETKKLSRADSEYFFRLNRK